MRNVLRGLAGSPPTRPEVHPTSNMGTSSSNMTAEPPPPPRMFQSPHLLSDAVRRLTLSASDRPSSKRDVNKPHDREGGTGGGTGILRIMTNLLTLSQHRVRRDSELKPMPMSEILKSYALLAGTRRSMVFLVPTADVAGADIKVATRYVFLPPHRGKVASRDDVIVGLRGVYSANAKVAKQCRRYDHERIFETLCALLPIQSQLRGPDQAFDPFSVQVIRRLCVLSI